MDRKSRQIKLGNTSGRQIYVVRKIDEHPVKGRRIGHNTQRIVVHFKLAIGIFNHNAAACGIVHNIVQGQRGPAGQRQRCFAHPNPLEALAHFVHRCIVCKHPVGHLKIGNGFAGKGRIKWLIARKTGKQQHAYHKAFFVHAVADYGRGKVAHAHKAVFCRPAQAAFVAVGQGSTHGRALGKNSNHCRG